MKGYAPHPDYESLQSLFASMRQWLKGYRDACKDSRDLTNCGLDEIVRIAQDLNLQPEELAMIAKKDPHSADLLQKLLAALGVDPNDLSQEDPVTMNDLRRLCTMCTEKRQCKYDLANGVLAANFRDYCPNAYTLDALVAATK